MKSSKVRSTVEQILVMSQEARNSDKMLLLTFMAWHGVHLDNESANNFLKMPSLESARRERQKFQEAGYYQSSEQIALARKWKSQEITQKIKTTKPENTGNLFNVRIVQETVDRYLENPYSVKAQVNDEITEIPRKALQDPLFDIKPKRTD